MKLISSWIAVILLLSIHSFAQSTINGKVFDIETREPLAGANVSIPGTGSGTYTNVLGNFTLHSAGIIDSVNASFVGYKSITLKVRSEEPLLFGLEPSVQNLQTISVTASRDGQVRSDIPAAINIISSQIILETNPTQLNQLLNKVPGLIMKDLGNEQHMMSIRQPMTSRPYFLYLEDGIPIAPVGNFNHNQLIEVNMLGIRTIEVAKGPASSIYGSNAVGGAINFITQSPTLIPVGKIGYQQNHFGYQRLEFFGGGYLTPDLGISIGGYMAKQRDGWQAYSDFDKLSISAKLNYTFNDKNDITAYVTSNSLHTQTGGSIDSIGFYSRKYLANNNFAYRKVEALRGRLTFNHYWNDFAKTNFSLYLSRNVIGQNPRYRIRNVDKLSARGEENVDSYFNYGGVIQHSHNFSFLQSKLIAGASANLAPTK
jgi:outer membrane receptor protein involved in Fe transport